MVFGDSPQFTLRGEAVAVGEDDMWIAIPLFSMNLPNTNFAPVYFDSSQANAPMFTRRFDDTVGTPKFANWQDILPNNVNSAGTVVAYVSFYAQTPAASKNVALRIGHHVVANDESRNLTYTAWNSGDIAVINTAGDLQIHTFTETVANLGWAASAVPRALRLRVSRQAASVNELAGDVWWECLRIFVPTTGNPS